MRVGALPPCRGPSLSLSGGGCAPLQKSPRAGGAPGQALSRFSGPGHRDASSHGGPHSSRWAHSFSSFLLPMCMHSLLLTPRLPLPCADSTLDARKGAVYTLSRTVVIEKVLHSWEATVTLCLHLLEGAKIENVWPSPAFLLFLFFLPSSHCAVFSPPFSAQAAGTPEPVLQHAI